MATSLVWPELVWAGSVACWLCVANEIIFIFVATPGAEQVDVFAVYGSTMKKMQHLAAVGHETIAAA